jgi:uncharacterized membrane protein SpoIIM required for sporulation
MVNFNPNKTNKAGFFKKGILGQGVIEYTLLIITVAAAFMAMNYYVRRAVNDRLHSAELEMSPDIVVEQQ